MFSQTVLLCVVTLWATQVQGNVHYRNREYGEEDIAVGALANATLHGGRAGYHEARSKVDRSQHGRQGFSSDRMNRYRQLLSPIQQSEFQRGGSSNEQTYNRDPYANQGSERFRDERQGQDYILESVDRGYQRQAGAHQPPQQSTSKRPDDDDKTTMIIVFSIIGVILAIIGLLSYIVVVCFILYIIYCCCCKKKNTCPDTCCEVPCCEVQQDCCNTPCGGGGSSCGSGTPIPSHRFRSTMLRDAGGGMPSRMSRRDYEAKRSGKLSVSDLSKDWDVSYAPQPRQATRVNRKPGTGEPDHVPKK